MRVYSEITVVNASCELMKACVISLVYLSKEPYIHKRTLYPQKSPIYVRVYSEITVVNSSCESIKETYMFVTYIHEREREGERERENVCVCGSVCLRE